MRWYRVITVVAVVAGLTSGLLFLQHAARPELRELSTHINTESNRAYCAKHIERVRVVNLIPGELHKPVKLGELDQQFLRHAKHTLDQFWHGEILTVVTNNNGALFPVSDREMTLVFAQEANGSWRAFALLFSESELLGDVQSAASRDDTLGVSGSVWSPPKGKVRGRYFNKTGNFWSVGYDNKTGEFHRVGDGTGDTASPPKLFVRSLQDIVVGRCDRLMSEAINGPVAWRKPVKQEGEF